MEKQGSLIVLVGPSGSGKGTVISELLKSDDKTFLSVSATTRNPRPGEVDGINYLFITRDEFQGLIDTDSMLEYACYCENYYGTPKATVLSRLKNGENVILEIEMQGARQIKQMYSDAILIFLTPPSFSVLNERLRGRKTEDEATIQKRLATAIKEMDFSLQCDFIVINNTIEQAVDDIKTIINASKLASANRKDFITEFLAASKQI